MQTAYPDSFAGLIDITLVESPESAGDLTGRSRRRRDSGDALDEIDTLWVVRRIDYPERSAAADDAFLTDAGFEQVEAWVGPLDAVLRFER